MMAAETIIRHCRRNAGFNQKDFAAKLGISPQHMNDLETGRRNLSPEMADRLHKALSLCDDAYDGSDEGLRSWHLVGARQHGWKV